MTRLLRPAIEFLAVAAFVLAMCLLAAGLEPYALTGAA